MQRSLPTRLIGLLICMMALSPVEAAPSGGGVVGGACTETDLNNALAGGGLITFACGGPKIINLTAVKTIVQDTTLDGANLIFLTGGLSTRLFSVNAGVRLTLKNIIIDEGKASSNGGAIVNHGSLIVDHSTIQFSQTDIGHSGGGIFSDGPVLITNSTLNHNQAGNAGALFADTAGARVQINNSTFSNNQAIDSVNGFGGAIWVDQQAQLTMDSPYLSNNHARLGGALYISPGSAVTVTGAAPSPTFELNSASSSGGAIYNVAGGSLTTVATLLTHNHVPTNTLSAGSGGAIASGGPLALHQTYFIENDAKYGGGLLIDAGGTPSSIVLEHASFVGNYAFVSGGGLYAAFTGAVVTVTSTIFDENLADTGGGGGIARHNAHLTVHDSSFLSNRAGAGGGGGLWADASGGSSTGGAVQVLDSTFASNHVQNLGKGGAIKNTGAQVNLRNVTLAENDGGVFNFGSDEVMSTTNSVYWNAGFLNCNGDGTLPQSQGGNYSSDNSCSFNNIADEKNVVHDPLGPRTLETENEIYGIVYYLPAAGSSLINAARPVCSPRDQRGALRPNACDKGAVEFGGLLPRVFVPLLRK